MEAVPGWGLRRGWGRAAADLDEGGRGGGTRGGTGGGGGAEDGGGAANRPGRWRRRQNRQPVSYAIDTAYRCRWRSRQVGWEVDGVGDRGGGGRAGAWGWGREAAGDSAGGRLRGGGGFAALRSRNIAASATYFFTLIAI
jgi:hypothetical protein